MSFGLDLVSWLQELVGASMKIYLTTMRRKRNSDLNLIVWLFVVGEERQTTTAKQLGLS